MPGTKARLSRRRFVAGGAAVASAALIDAFGIEPRWLEVSEHVVPIAGLPKSLEGFLIAQLTDTHLRSVGSVDEKILSVVRGRRPNAVVLTGDAIDSAVYFPVLAAVCDAIRQTGAALLATLGNWEHWGSIDLDTLGRVYAKTGAKLLVNEHASIDGVSFDATDDGYAGTPRWDAFAAAHEGAPRILLTHSPALLDRLPRDMPKFDLSLSGHTHGGQLRAGTIAPVLPLGSGRFVAGSYDTPAGPAYVSRGTGTSVVPARFSCRPELPLFRLVRA